jgi:hypothetical protein
VASSKYWINALAILVLRFIFLSEEDEAIVICLGSPKLSPWAIAGERNITEANPALMKMFNFFFMALVLTVNNSVVSFTV